jgi:hypothetical protein
MSNEMTMTQFQRVLPKQVKKQVSQKLVDQINSTLGDPVLMENYRENLLSYTSVMQDGKYKISTYIDAVRYVSFKLIGSTNVEAYARTFPDRYQRLVDIGTSGKDIASYVTSFNKNKLVNLIFEQTLVPSHILNADLYQKALNVQAALMVDDHVSPKVRSDAANSLLVHLKMPETQKIELDIGLKEDKTINDLRNSTMALVAQQRQMLEAGAVNAKEVAHSNLIIEHSELD